MAEIKSVLEQIKECIDNKISFIVDAGAGSGKTFSLMQTLEYIATKKLNKNQQVLCITYTNAGVNEIKNRLFDNSLFSNIIVSTIHDFVWDYIKQFQIDLRNILKEMINETVEKLNYEISEAERKLASSNPRVNREKQKEIITTNSNKLEKYVGLDISSLIVDYDLYKALYKGKISHDEIIKIAIKFFDNDNFKNIFINNFPYVIIDEYQDTNIDLLKTLINTIISSNCQSVLGLYGDVMQRIYERNTINLDEFDLHKIEKLDNFRTNIKIVKANNILRNDGLMQNCDNQNPTISFKELIFVYNTSDDQKLENFKQLASSFNEYKRLYLSNKNIACEVGFQSIANLYTEEFNQSANERLFKQKDPMINFIISHVINFVCDVNNGNFKSIIKKLHFNTQLELSAYKEIILNHSHQIEKPIADLIDFCIVHNLVDKKRYEELFDGDYNDLYIRLINIPLKEFLALYQQIMEKTMLDTLHGVKGREYDSVIVNLFQNQPWNQYNFDKLLHRKDIDSFSVLNAHKLLYVACTRAKNSLIINYISDRENLLDLEELKDCVKELWGEEIKFVVYT